MPVTGTYGTLTIHEDGSGRTTWGRTCRQCLRSGRRTFVEETVRLHDCERLGLEATAQLRITVGRSTVTATGTPTRTHVAPIARDNEGTRMRSLSPTIVGNMITTVDAMYGVTRTRVGPECLY